MAPRGRFELPGGFRPTSFPGLRLGPLGYLGTRILNHAGKNEIDTRNIDVPAFEKFFTLINLSCATVTNHLRALNTFLKYKNLFKIYLSKKKRSYPKRHSQQYYQDQQQVKEDNCSDHSKSYLDHIRVLV